MSESFLGLSGWWRSAINAAPNGLDVDPEMSRQSRHGVSLAVPCDEAPPRRRRQRLLYRPSVLVQPCGDNVSPNRELASPLTNRHRAIAECYVAVASTFVVCLLNRGGPPYIARFVTAPIVDSIYRVTRRWSRPDIGTKALERLRPLVTHRYSAAAICLVVNRVFIKTAILYRLPDSVLSCTRLPVRRYESTILTSHRLWIHPSNFTAWVGA